MAAHIIASHLLSGLGFPSAESMPEAATQTFKVGAPLKLDGSGDVIECTFVGADIILGFSQHDGANLTTADTPKHVSVGSVPNQPNSTKIPVGAPPSDGQVLFNRADGNTVFEGRVLTGQTPTKALISSTTFYGLTKNGTTAIWEVDTTDTAGNNAVVKIVGVSEDDSGIVFFQVKEASRFYL